MRKLLLILLACQATPVVAAVSAVDAVLELPRTRPIHYVDAVLALVDLGAADLAEPIAAELAALPLDDEARVALVAEAGTARLLRLARVAPSAAEWAEAALRAASAAAVSPERLGGLVRRLTSQESTAARAALIELERTGAAGVVFCARALADADEAKSEARLREALVALYPQSGPTLVVALESSDDALRREAAYAWGRLADLNRIRSGLPAALLVGPALLEANSAFGKAAQWSHLRLTGEPANPESATRSLRKAIDALLAGSLPFAADFDGRIGWPASAGSQPEAIAARDVALRVASMLADSLAELRPDDPTATRLALLLQHESGRPHAGDRPLDALPTDDLNRCLAEALDRPFPRAAIACCEALAERRDNATLFTLGGELSPLAVALEAPDAAVRYAALGAIMAIDPSTPFAGSSRVAEALAHFAAATGERRAVVAAPQLARAANLASQLRAAGYDATAVNRGAEAVEAAAATPDTEIVLLDMNTLLPSTRETLFRLRRTPATAETPVALLASDGRLGAAETLALDHGGEAGAVLVWPRIHTVEDAAALAEQLGELGPTGEGAEVRRERATQAAVWADRLRERGTTFYRLTGFGDSNDR